MRIRAKITSKGQTTIPSEVREYLNLDCGDHIEFVQEGDRIYLSPKNLRIATMAGLLGKPPNGRTASVDDMEAVIVDASVIANDRVLNDRN